VIALLTDQRRRVRELPVLLAQPGVQLVELGDEAPAPLARRFGQELA
jgi:hypothetical protein